MEQEFILNKYNDLFSEVKDINNSLKNINLYLDDCKKKEELKEKLNEKNQKKIDLEKENNLKTQQKLYSNIETISFNSNKDLLESSMKDISTLMQVSIMTNGLVIGILCIVLFSKFFKGIR